MPNRHESSDKYRYGFQGQEKDDEIKGEGNSINYKFRMHDPRVGRFFAVDPLESNYPWYTPYQFSGNKVIRYVELEGLENVDPFSDEGFELGLGDGWEGDGTAKKAEAPGVFRQTIYDGMDILWEGVVFVTEILSIPSKEAGKVINDLVLDIPDENGKTGYYNNLPSTEEAVTNGDEGMFYSSIANEQRVLIAGTASVYTEFMVDAVVVDGLIEGSSILLKSSVGNISKFDDALHQHLSYDYNSPNRYMDCSDIASGYKQFDSNNGSILEIVSKDGKPFQGMEYGEQIEFHYHQVYEKNGLIYDPMYGPDPIPKETFKKEYKNLNPNSKLEFNYE